MTPFKGARVLNDFLSGYFADTTLASAFVVRRGRPRRPEAYQVREAEPEPRVGAGRQKTP
jgi:hypothetical protein